MPSHERKEFRILKVIRSLEELGERLLLLSVREHGVLMATHFHRGGVTSHSPLHWFLANGALHENISV